MLKYYGVWEKRFEKKKNLGAMAQTIAHLVYIRDGEAEENPLRHLFKKK